MTADRSKGVIVWTEDPDNNNQSIVLRRDFTVDFTVNESGDLKFVGEAVTILPLVGEEAPEGHTLSSYANLDIWGDANHGLLFLVTNRRTGFVPNTGIKKVLIYDLNTLTDVNAGPGVREIYHENILTWGGYPDWKDADEPGEPDCNGPDTDPDTGVRFFFPRFIASCYRPEPFRFNSSGTRIYFSSKLFLFDGRREFAEMRINIDWKESSDPTIWEITGPEIVYVNGPRDALPRPSPLPQVLPSPEIVMAQWDDQFLDADLCAEEYADRSGANSDPETTIWLEECLVFGLFTNSDTSFRAWDSSDSYLFYRSGKKRQDDDEIYRFYVSGGRESIEEKLIENGNSPSSGF